MEHIYMAAKINIEITESNFEKIRDRICEILVTEFANQYFITGDELFNLVIWKERFIAFDKTELPAINVFFNNATYSEKDINNSFGENRFSIEIVTNAKHTDTERGDTKASEKLQKILRIVRYVLENPNYLTLDFVRGFISSTAIESIRATQPNSTGDGMHTITGQAIFKANLKESNGDIAGIPGENYNTSVKLNQTDKGYYFEYIV